ncbi:ClpP/crotonase-like domain-containing protein [Mycena capillaripes]|nr:ClpP/crotonase-like domain-containing protein [Mycena capillaripes]
MLRQLHCVTTLALLALLALSASAARYSTYGTLQTINSSGVMNVVINNIHSSINLFDDHMQSDLANLIETLQANDTDIRVVVFSSGNPEFFIGHLDVNSVLPGYLESSYFIETESALPIFDLGNPNLTFLEALLWNITELPQATIAVVEGLETSLGLNPGAGGAMYVSQLIGRGCAFEYMLASKDIDAATAESYGWINRAFQTSEELKEYVRELAARIALFPRAGIVGTKQGINAVSRPPLDVLIRDAQNVIGVLERTPEAQALATRFITATNNQSIGELELNYGADLESLFK